MNLSVLDYYFPIFVLVYGCVMTALSSSNWFTGLSRAQLPQALTTQFLSHRLLGFVCLVVGALWSLQNLWLSEPPL